MDRTDGCRECGMAYSFYFGVQFHKADCAQVKAESHQCEENAVPYKSEGVVGHGWECGDCGKFLQAG